MRGIVELIRGPLRSPADLRAALADLGDCSNAVEIEAAEAKRREALISGGEADVERADKALALAHRKRDRLAASREELEKRLAEAEAKDAADQLTAQRAEAERAAQDCLKFLKRYPALAKEIVAGLEALLAAEQAVAAVNMRLAEAGRIDERLELVESRVVPVPTWTIGGSLIASVVLPKRDGYSVGWNG